MNKSEFIKELYQSAFNSEIEKIGFLDYAKDFAAGVDPTGTSTFRLASKYKKHHKKHRAAGDVGGFVGGVAMGASLPAGVIGLTSLALRRKFPGLSKEFATAAKGSLDVINPKRFYKHIKSIPDIIKYKKLGIGVIKGSRKLTRDLSGVEKKYKGTGNSMMPTSLSDIKKAKKLRSNAESFRSKQDEFDKFQKTISKKYYGGKDPSEGIARTMTALTTAPAAIATGVLNTSSAHMQYNEARRQKKKS